MVAESLKSSASGSSLRTGSRAFMPFLLVWLSCSLSPALALDKSDDIDTNRPSFTDSPLVVPKGTVQFENGTLYQRFTGGANYFDLPENEVRVGLLKKLEFQVFTPQFIRLSSGSQGNETISITSPRPRSSSTTVSGVQSGASDIQEMGFKRQFGPYFKDLNISVIGGVTVPTGRKLLSSGGVQPVFRAPWNKGLPKKITIGGMQSLTLINQGKDVQWQNFWIMSRSIGRRSAIFAEYAGFYTSNEFPVNIAHFGAVRKLNRHHQIDVHFGFGMNRNAPIAFVGGGYSFRFDKLPW